MLYRLTVSYDPLISFRIIEIGTSRKPVCHFLLVVNSNVGHIFYSFRDIVMKTLQIAVYPSLIKGLNSTDPREPPYVKSDEIGVTFCTGWMSLIASVLESASRCSSVSMGWHQTTCLLCATLHPDSLDARIFALRIADSSTFHALNCRRAVFEPSRMLVHLCGTLCPLISRTAIWLLQLSCAILSLIFFLSTDFVLSAFGAWSHKRAI